MIEEPEAATRMIRSPSYPGINLETAIQRASTFYERENKHPTPTPTVLRHWKYSPKSGPGFTTLAAVKQFGLITDTGRGQARKVQLSDLGLKIVQDRRPASPERLAAIRTAALYPTVFAELHEKYGTTASDDNLAYFLEQRGFTPTAAQEVVRNYRESLAFAQLDGNPAAELLDLTLGKVDDEEEEEEDGGHDDLPPDTRKRGKVTSVPIMLPSGAQVKIEGTFPLTEADFDYMLTLLPVFKPGWTAVVKSTENE